MPDPSVPDTVKHLKTHLATITDLRSASAVLHWDQETYMPPRGTAGRAEQLATLARLTHNLFVSPTTHDLLKAAEAVLARLDADSDEAAVIRMTRRDYDRQSRLPADFVAAKARAASLCVQIWRDARPRDDFAAFRPALQEMVDLARREAEYVGFQDHPYDALLDDYEPSMTTRDVDRLFARLREVTVPFVRAIVTRGRPVDASVLTQDYDPTEQRAFGLKVAEAFGYDLMRGRLDESAHPFTESFGPDDVRITTRYQRTFLPSAIFAIFHETGHALYEQGIPPALARTNIAQAASLGLHESQSRLWENLVGRSRPFWQVYYPVLQDHFPQLRRVELEAFYRAVNRVQPSLIRVEADEVTYNLHIMLRYELEKQLVEGSLSVTDLPDAWNDRMNAYLGVVPPTHENGVMQDIHWASGYIGYFPTYTLGNIISVQLFDAARRAHPALVEDIGRGQFATLLGWLREHVHRHGRKFLPQEIVRRATGTELTPEPYLQYLKRKFGDIYQVTVEETARRSS
jgi:carboxypeptidase Taq